MQAFKLVPLILFALASSAYSGDFAQDMRDALERDGLSSLTFQQGIVRIRMASPSVMSDHHGVVPMACAFAAGSKVSVKELRVVAANGKGWRYPLSPKACEEVIAEVSNQRAVLGKNSFHQFIEQHRIPIARLD